MKKKNHSNEKLETITFKILIVGVDIAKHNQWARFVDYRGMEHNKVLKFKNNRNRITTFTGITQCSHCLMNLISLSSISNPERYITFPKSQRSSVVSRDYSGTNPDIILAIKWRDFRAVLNIYF